MQYLHDKQLMLYHLQNIKKQFFLWFFFNIF